VELRVDVLRLIVDVAGVTDPSSLRRSPSRPK